MKVKYEVRDIDQTFEIKDECATAPGIARRALEE